MSHMGKFSLGHLGAEGNIDQLPHELPDVSRSLAKPFTMDPLKYSSLPRHPVEYIVWDWLSEITLEA